MTSLSSKIEAILYLKAQPLSIARIAEYASCERDTAAAALLQLMADYTHRDGALEVIETPDGYCMQLRESFHSLIQQLIPVDLGVGALRTLAAIALKGSITQPQLVELRGSGVYQHVPELVELGFVRKRRQSDGRSYWLQVTEKFYQYFQVDQLPQPFTQAGSAAQKSRSAATEVLEPDLEPPVEENLEKDLEKELPPDAALDSELPPDVTLETSLL